MSAIGIALIALICSFGGACVGVLLRERLPDAHLSQDTAEVVKLSTGLVGTMAALVLGLLVASAATEFNAEATGLQTLATDLILLDHALRHYGPEAGTARERLHNLVERAINQATSGERRPLENVRSAQASTAASPMFDAVRDLSPRTEAQKMILNQPFDGLIRVSIDPIRGALAELNN
jgi:hypothetical protein